MNLPINLFGHIAQTPHIKTPKKTNLFASTPAMHFSPAVDSVHFGKTKTATDAVTLPTALTDYAPTDAERAQVEALFQEIKKGSMYTDAPQKAMEKFKGLVNDELRAWAIQEALMSSSLKLQQASSLALSSLTNEDNRFVLTQQVIKHPNPNLAFKLLYSSSKTTVTFQTPYYNKALLNDLLKTGNSSAIGYGYQFVKALDNDSDKIQFIEKMLNHKDPEINRAGARCVDYLESPKHIRHYLDIYSDDPNPILFHAISRAIKNLPDEATKLPYYLKTLQSEDGIIVAQALQRLCEFENNDLLKQAVPYLDAIVPSMSMQRSLDELRTKLNQTVQERPTVNPLLHHQAAALKSTVQSLKWHDESTQARFLTEYFESETMLPASTGTQLLEVICDLNDPIAQFDLLNAFCKKASYSPAGLHVSLEPIASRLTTQQLQTLLNSIVNNPKTNQSIFNTVFKALPADGELQLAIIQHCLQAGNPDMQQLGVQGISLLPDETMRYTVATSIIEQSDQRPFIQNIINQILPTISDETHLADMLKRCSNKKIFNRTVLHALHSIQNQVLLKELLTIGFTSDPNETNASLALIPHIANLSSDEDKAELLTMVIKNAQHLARKISSSPALLKSIASLNSDDIKLTFLKQVMAQGVTNIASVVESFKSDSVKIDLIEELIESENKNKNITLPQVFQKTLAPLQPNQAQDLPKHPNGATNWLNTTPQAKVTSPLLRSALSSIASFKNQKLGQTWFEKVMRDYPDVATPNFVVTYLSGSGVMNTKQQQGVKHLKDFMTLCKPLANLPTETLYKLKELVDAEPDMNNKEALLTLSAGILPDTASQLDPLMIAAEERRAIMGHPPKEPENQPKPTKEQQQGSISKLNTILNSTAPLQRLKKQYLSTMLQSAGVEVDEATMDLDVWNMAYINKVAIALKSMKPEVAADLKAIVQKTANGTFMDWIQDPESAPGKMNTQTKAEFETLGLDYDKWLHYGTEQSPVLAKKNKIMSRPELLDQANSTLMAILTDLMGSRAKGTPGILMEANNKAGKNALFNTITKSEGYKISNGKLTHVKNEKMAPDGLGHLIGQIKHCLANNDALDLDLARQLNRVTDILLKAKTAPKTREPDYVVKIWDRQPGHDLFQGNYSSCCVALNNAHSRRSILDYLMHSAIQLVEVIDEETGKNVATSFLYWAVDEDKNPALTIDNIEYGGGLDDEARRALTQGVIQLTGEVARDVGGDKAKALWRGHRADLVTPKKMDVERAMSVMGKTISAELHLDSRKRTLSPLDKRKFKDITLPSEASEHSN